MNPDTEPSTHRLTDTDVHWFGASHRTIGGKPDSRYGWLPMADGVWIIKAMDPELVAYNKTLLDHERRMLQRLNTLGAPAPAWVDAGRSDWLATRFAGLSLHRLEHPGGLQGVAPQRRFSFAERLATWAHLLRRLQPMADAGVLAVDLYDANVVVPLTNGLEGQLRLHEAALIDHAYTLEPGMALRRPVWIDRDMARIAPELRSALRQDQEALIAHFHAEGAALPGYSRLPGERDTHSRRIWAEYEAPQALQQLLDAGELSRDHAMQFAAATAISSLLARYAEQPQRAELARVLRRMTEPTPDKRYPTLMDAADALAGVLKTVPMVSQHRYETLQPSDLAVPSVLSTSKASRVEAVGGSEPGTMMAQQPAINPTALPAEVLPRHAAISRDSYWTYAAAAIGAAAGVFLPLPW